MLSCGLFQELDINDVENMFNDYYTCQGDLNRFVEKHSGEEDKEFVARLNKFLKDNNTVYSIWLRMQHHNVPTHLIDTTRSFYIAAYFALFNSIKECSEKESNYPAIIATKRYHNPTIDLLQWHFSRTSHIRNVDNYIHERPWVQQAAHIDSFLPTKYLIKKLIIDPHWLSDIYFDLKLMNITGYSLFGTKEMAGLDYYFFAKFGNFIK